MKHRIPAVLTFGLCLFLVLIAGALVYLYIQNWTLLTASVPAPAAETPAETALAETTVTPVPTETPEPTPKPDPILQKRDKPAPKNYFSDAAFLGNSMIMGLEYYDYDGMLDGAAFFWRDDVTITGIGSLLDEMDGQTFRKIYVELGGSELAQNREDIRQSYENLIDALWIKNPGASIYIMSVTPPSKYRSSVSSSYNKSLVESFNRMLLEIARDKGTYYMDVYTALGDEEGFIPSPVTEDGIHFTPEHYTHWFDVLTTYYAD